MFPLSDSIKTRRFPILTIFLIIINAFVFLQEISAPDIDAFINHYSLIPSHVNPSHLATLLPFITTIFVHGGLLHILSNMWFLFIFGDNVEDVLPPPMYLLLFLTAGVIGNIVQYVFLATSSIPMIGASGAVAGILGCYYILFLMLKLRRCFLFSFL